jgi:hypothetical protein
LDIVVENLHNVTAVYFVGCTKLLQEFDGFLFRDPELDAEFFLIGYLDSDPGSGFRV